MTHVYELQEEIGAINAANGWHDRLNKLWGDHDDAGIADHVVAKLALIGTEVAEAIEDMRDGRIEATVTDTGKPVGLPSELADIIIRTIDLAYVLGVDIDEAIVTKIAANRGRGHMHGGKRL